MGNLLNTQLKFATNLTTQLNFGKRNKQLNFLITQLHRETKGLKGGVSSLGDEGRNYEGGDEI